MSDNKMLLVIGGANINGNLLSAISKMISIVLEIGRAIGSAIHRYKTGNKCY